MTGMNNFNIPTIIARVITLLIAFTIHELAHAWSAHKLGDDTAKNLGRLTLNPLAHLDPMGTLLLIVAGFGWAKPVPVNPYNLRIGPKTGMGVVALAGPVSNIIMAILAALPFRLGLMDVAFGTTAGFLPSFGFVLTQFVWINLILALFNMIPVPPLDGSKVLMWLLPDELSASFQSIERVGPILLLALVFTDMTSFLILGPSRFLFEMLMG